MPSSRWPETGRRRLLAAGLAGPMAWLGGPAAHAQAPGSDAALAALRAGGVVLALRHALAPGTFDPPGFRLGDCGTQRNLSDEGREQARRLGAWLGDQGLQPARVRASPWCRCTETAALAFGAHEVWAALGSPRGASETTSAAHQEALRQALRAARQRAGGFEVWVTHQFVLSDLVSTATASGEGLVLRADERGRPQVLARLAPA